MLIRDRSGFTLLELLIVVAIIAIIAAIAIPGLLRARVSSNEASAIGSLRAINSSQHAFSSSCAHGDFASVLSDLAIAPPGSVAFLSPDLVGSPSVTKSGYNIEMNRGSDSIPGTFDACNGVVAAALGSNYYAFADPVTVGTTGVRYFWTNTLATIYVDTAATLSGETVGSAQPSSGSVLQ